MNRYLRLLSLIFIITILLIDVKRVNADNKPLVIKFSDFQYKTSDYDKDDVSVVKKEGINESIHIIDNKSGKVLKELSIKKINKDNENVIPYTIKRTKTYGDTKVIACFEVELYHNGSFRAINSYRRGFVYIISPKNNTYLENYSINAYSNSGFPCSELNYYFMGTITTKTPNKLQELGVSLFGTGISITNSLANTYYRQNFQSIGIIELY